MRKGQGESQGREFHRGEKEVGGVRKSQQESEDEQGGREERGEMHPPSRVQLGLQLFKGVDI